MLRAARGRIVLLFLGLLLSTPCPAQPPRHTRILIRPQRPLTFGSVLAGVPANVGPADPQRAGMYLIRGNPEAEVVLSLTLPGHLLGPNGSQLPVEFGSEDGSYRRGAGVQPPEGFDPTVPYVNRLGRNGIARVSLGGTVRPGPSQRAGDYRAIVTLTVAYTGN